MSTVIDELVADVGASVDEAAELSAFLRELEQLAETDPPEPSEELAALLLAPKVGRSHRHRLRLVAAAGAVAAVSAATATGVAAAANELPPPAQELVAEFSERYLPFHFPQPVISPAPAEIPTDLGLGAGRDAPLIEPPVQDPPAPIPDDGSASLQPKRNSPGPEPRSDEGRDGSPGGSGTPAPTAPSAPAVTTSPEPSQQPSPTPDPSGSPEPGETPGGDPRVPESPPPSPPGEPEEPEAGEEPSPTAGGDPGAGAGPTMHVREPQS